MADHGAAHPTTHRAHAVEHYPGLLRHGGQRGRVAHIAQQHAHLRAQRRFPCVRRPPSHPPAAGRAAVPRPAPPPRATRPRSVPRRSAARSSTSCSLLRLRPATAQRRGPRSSPPLAVRATSSTTNCPVKPLAPNTTSS